MEKNSYIRYSDASFWGYFYFAQFVFAFGSWIGEHTIDAIKVIKASFRSNRGFLFYHLKDRQSRNNLTFYCRYFITFYSGHFNLDFPYRCSSWMAFKWTIPDCFYFYLPPDTISWKMVRQKIQTSDLRCRKQPLYKLCHPIQCFLKFNWLLKCQYDDKGNEFYLH